MSKALFMAASAAGAVAKTYVDDVFSTWLYQGNGSSQTITNGIDLAGQGGMVWVKSRSGTTGHRLTDTARGATKSLESNSADAEATESTGVTAFGSSGFSIGGDADYNTNGATYASWTFRKAPKFFDVVTYTGNGSNRDIAHSLGVAPGCIFVKRTDTAANWAVYHRSIAGGQYAVLNSTAGFTLGSSWWNNTNATSSVFTVGFSDDVNANGGTYVAYLFAHDTAPDGLIQCGLIDWSGATQQINLGWEPQFIIERRFNQTGGNWYMMDTVREMSVSRFRDISADLSSAETLQTSYPGSFTPNATGFTASNWWDSDSLSVYIAIRRPNKPPTTGTQVYGATANSSPIDTGNPVALNPPASDLWLSSQRSSFEGYTVSRLTSWSYNQTTLAIAEAGPAPYNFQQLDQADLIPAQVWYGATPQINWFFKRAPGVFDVVCDLGTGAAHTIAHSLGVVPELIIRKSRSGTTDWQVYCANLANTQKLVLNSTAAVATDTAAWNSTTPTASSFTVGTGAAVNTNGETYITFLFATLAGISKVGTYTGDGTVGKTINCGFTTGARFVLIKRTNTTGDWFVWDTARGIIAGNDPHLSLNTTAAEVTGDDTIDPDTSGFIVNQRAATNVNVSGATYIFLAIA